MPKQKKAVSKMKSMIRSVGAFKGKADSRGGRAHGRGGAISRGRFSTATSASKRRRSPSTLRGVRRAVGRKAA